MQTQRRLALAGLVVCVVALLAELAVQTSGHLAGGGTVAGAVLRFLSYYTVVTNILLVGVYAACLKPAQALSIFQDARVRTMAAGVITLVMLVYALILSRVEHPHGLGKLSVIAAHYVAPPIYLIWWAATSGHDRLSLRDIPLMATPSVAYMAYVLMHGYLTGKYPYAMLDADRLSLSSMILHGLGMLLALLAACAIFIVLGRRLAARRRAKLPIP